MALLTITTALIQRTATPAEFLSERHRVRGHIPFLRALCRTECGQLDLVAEVRVCGEVHHPRTCVATTGDRETQTFRRRSIDLHPQVFHTPWARLGLVVMLHRPARIRAPRVEQPAPHILLPREEAIRAQRNRHLRRAIRAGNEVVEVGLSTAAAESPHCGRWAEVPLVGKVVSPVP